MEIEILDPTKNPGVERHTAILEVLWGARAVLAAPQGYWIERDPEFGYNGPFKPYAVDFPTGPDHTPQAVWETLLARGLFPESWHENPARVFFTIRAGVPWVVSVGTSPKRLAAGFLDVSLVFAPYIPQGFSIGVPAEVPVLPPQGPRTNFYPPGVLSGTLDPALAKAQNLLTNPTSFPSPQQVLDLAFHPLDLLEQVESLVFELAARLRPFGGPPVTRIAWGFGAAPTATAPPIVPFLAPALACALSPYLPPGAPLWTAEGLSDPSVREVLEATWDLYLPTHANPFPVLTALDALRYGVSFWGFSDGAALVLVRPVASLFP